MDIQKMLDDLTELYAQNDLLSINKKRLEESIIPEDVKRKLLEVKIEYATKEESIQEKIAKLEKEIKEAVVQEGQTVKSGNLQAVFTSGRVTWETKGLEGLMVAVPQLKQFKKVGLPSVSIRKV